MNEFISNMKKNELSSYASAFIEEKVIESKQFLDNFTTGLRRPKFDILRGLRTNMKNVMTNIYEIHNDIMFLTEDIGINELFAQYLPNEYIESLPQNPKDATQYSSTHAMNLVKLETENKMLLSNLEDQHKNAQNLQTKNDQLNSQIRNLELN